MCGIAGFLDHSHNTLPYDLKRVATGMAETMIARGPDDGGVWIDQANKIALAHRRLAVIDLTPAGHQPMVSRDKRYVLTYNGEIYNSQELRNELERRNQSFRGTSDSEILLEACATWGVEQTVKRCIGMFAFGLWDRQEHTLKLVRDRLGIKPLYWAQFGQLFLFGSELKALRAHPGFLAQIDFNAVATFMRFSYIIAPQSIYTNVYKLEPACILTFQRGQPPHIERYWDIREIARQGAMAPQQFSDAEGLECLEHILEEAVRCRMIADVPLGAFLSGGVDSSTVVALMQKHRTTTLKTFTIGYPQRDFDESQYARKISAHLGTDHRELIVEPHHIHQILPQLPECYDEPFSDTAQIPTFLVSQLTRQEVTVALSGDGGDELFAGYNRYFKVEKKWQRVTKMPKAVRPTLSRVLRIFPHLFDEFMGRGPRKISNISKKLRRLGETYVWPNGDALNRHLLSRWGDPMTVVPGAVLEPKGAFWDDTLEKELPDLVTRLQFTDIVTNIPDQVLTRFDRASMAVSLEVRVPILDHRVVEFVWSLPRHMKIRHGERKWLLRQILYKYVPKKLIERPKMGFGIPLDDWIRGPLRDWAEELLSERTLKETGLLNPLPIRKKWSQHLSGTYDFKKQLWSALMLQAWYQRWM
jgi:asparagine synthase (glutamine-hydrolysing)